MRAIRATPGSFHLAAPRDDPEDLPPPPALPNEKGTRWVPLFGGEGVRLAPVYYQYVRQIYIFCPHFLPHGLHLLGRIWPFADRATAQAIPTGATLTAVLITDRNVWAPIAQRCYQPFEIEAPARIQVTRDPIYSGNASTPQAGAEAIIAQGGGAEHRVDAGVGFFTWVEGRFDHATVVVDTTFGALLNTESIRRSLSSTPVSGVDAREDSSSTCVTRCPAGVSISSVSMIPLHSISSFLMPSFAALPSSQAFQSATVRALLPCSVMRCLRVICNKLGPAVGGVEDSTHGAGRAEQRALAFRRANIGGAVGPGEHEGFKLRVGNGLLLGLGFGLAARLLLRGKASEVGFGVGAERVLLALRVQGALDLGAS